MEAFAERASVELERKGRDGKAVRKDRVHARGPAEASGRREDGDQDAGDRAGARVQDSPGQRRGTVPAGTDDGRNVRCADDGSPGGGTTAGRDRGLTEREVIGV